MKKNICIVIVMLLLTGAFTSCGDENLNDIAFNQFVVEAFLFAGEPVDDIKIKTVFPPVSYTHLTLPTNREV